MVTTTNNIVIRKEPLKVADLVAPMYETHKSTVNQSYEWRMDNLRKLRKVHTNHIDEWADALYKDLGKLRVEAVTSEIKLNVCEIDYFLSNLKSFMTPEQATSPGYNTPCFSQVERRPLRAPAVLVIGPSNYPLQLTLCVAAGALAGGNPVVIKPSEQTPATSNLMAKLCHEYFDAGSVQVVEGGKEVVGPLLEQEWGLLAFTGSERVGRIIAEGAAKTLTPCLMELGGKSPVYVDEDAPSPIRLVAQRIVFGKSFNAGQTCVSPDYLLVHESHKDALVKELSAAFDDQFGPNIESELGRMAQVSHATRLVELIEEAEKSPECKVVYGGSKLCDAKTKYIHPTLVVNPPKTLRLMKEEVFGPVLPIVTVQSRKEAQDYINAMHGIPLSLYVFTSKASVYRDMLRACPAASSLRNDVLVHFGSTHLPMGGLGSSGYGNYRGKYSWNTFTHAQSQVYRPCYPTADFGLARCHPYKSGMKERLMMILTDLPPVPPLRLRTVAMVGIVAYLVLSRDVLRFGVADALDVVVQWLRRKSP